MSLSEIRVRDFEDFDLAPAQAWLDKAHGAGRFQASIFRTAGIRGQVVEDGDGPVMYVIRTPIGDAERIDIQFLPLKNRRRTALGLAALFESVTADCRSRGVREIRFDSVAPALIGFMRRFGFREAPNNNFVLTLE